MRNRFAIFAAASLLALSPIGLARASPTDPLPEVRSAPAPHIVLSAREMPSIFASDLNQMILTVANKEQSSKESFTSIDRIVKDHFDDRSMVVVTAVTTARASPSYTRKRSDLPRRMQSTNNSSLAVEHSMVRRRCRSHAERHAAHTCDISTTNRRSIA